MALQHSIISHTRFLFGRPIFLELAQVRLIQKSKLLETELWPPGSLQLLEVLEIYWNVKTLPEIYHKSIIRCKFL